MAILTSELDETRLLSPHMNRLQVEIIATGKGRKLGKGGSLASRQAIIHSLVHIESWAVDLSWVRPM
eukprot:9502554-Pyramimonas_sp.AAC.2